MAIIRWDPFAELDSLHQLNTLFNNSFGQSRPQLSAPTVDIYRDGDKQMVVEAHLPNFKSDDVDVNVRDHALEIKAEHHEKEEDTKQRHYIVRESSNSFYRRIALPREADEPGVTAAFEEGILKVTVPFKELPKSTQIKIGSGNKKKK